MKKYSRFFKRTQSWVLTLALLLSAVTPVWSLSVFAEDDNLTGSFAESTIIANNYDDLTDAEKALLKSGYLVGEVHQFKIPDDNDGLISVDTDNKKITASPYTGTTGYTWKPVSAQIVTGSVVAEDIALTNGEGTYTFDGNAFSVKVKYALEKEIPAATQELLLNAPAWLATGLADLADAVAESGGVDLIDQAVPEVFLKLAKLDPESSNGFPFQTPFGGMYLFFLTQAAIDASQDLKDMLDGVVRDDDGQIIEGLTQKSLSDVIAEYNAAGNKTAYLIENGAEFKAVLKKTEECVAAIFEDGVWGTIEGGRNIPGNAILFTMLDELKAAAARLTEIDGREWAVIGKNLVKAGLTDDKLVKLDELVKAVSAPTGASLEIKNPLQLATTTVQHNMSMFDVTVNVALKVTDPTTNELVTYDTKTTKVTLAENATNLEILAAINESGIRANSVAEWKAAGKFVDGKFTSTENAIPDTLTQDFTFNTTYLPLTFNITFDYAGTTIPYYYGSKISLPVHTVEGKVYDYTIDKNYYPQGSNYTVVDNMTITRKEGKAYTSSNLYKIVADNYFAGNKTAADILNTGVLKGDTIVNVRYPDNINDAFVTLDGATLTVKPYPSSHEGLSWEPYSYTVDDTTVVEFDHNNHGTQAVEITVDNFGTVVVTYRLTLTSFDDAEILDIANIPNLLSTEAKAQLDALNRIAGKESNLKLLAGSTLMVLASFINETTLNADSAVNVALQKCFTDAIATIRSNAVDKTTGYLKIFEIAKAYNAASDPLFYYYQNHEYIQNEIAILAEALSAMLEAEEGLSADVKLKGLENLLLAVANDPIMSSQAGITPEDVGGENGLLSKITDLESIMVEVQNDLTAPNALIDTASGDLSKLTALLNQGIVAGLNTLPAKFFLSDSSISKDAEGKTSLSVTIQIEGEGEKTLTSDTVFNTDVISPDLITGLKNKIAAVLGGIDAKFYETNYDAAVLDALIGQVAGELAQTSFTFTWNYKDFTVSVPGTADQTVNIKNTVINLPASTDAMIRYDYYINGVKVIAQNGIYNLSAAELEQVANGTFNVTMKQVDVGQENLVAYVNSLNENMNPADGVFALYENNGEYSIVFKINSTAPDALTKAMMGLAQGIVLGSYPYVGLGGEAFLDDGSIYLQSILDAVGNSGFGSDSIIAMMDANGKINHMTLAGNVISDASVNELGGKLFGTTMELGYNAADVTSLPFYVTMGGASAEFLEVRNAFAGQLGSMISFICEDGAINANLNLPQKAYEAFLAALLVTEKIDLSSINDVDGAIAIGFVNDMLIPLFRGDITLETFENTLAMFGANVDLTSQNGAETIFNTIKDYYTNAVFTYDETSGTATGNLGIESLLDSFDLGPLANIIAEKDTGLDISLGIGLENLGNDYDALYLDINASGITNKIGLTSNLADKMDEIAGTSMIILFRDVTADLTCKTTTIFNLNGYSLKGSLKGVGKTIVIDSNVEEAVHGTITGGVSGNVTLVDGKYSYNVTDYIKAGFIQDADGMIVNQYYDIVEDANGNVIISLNASMIRNREFPDITGLALDLACDLLFNGYSSNYLALDGNTIYDITITDLVGLYGSSNRVDSVIDEVMAFVDDAQLNAFINTVLDDVMDFAALSEAVRNDKPIFDYTIVTKPWAVEFVHVKDGDYVTSNIASGEASKDAKLQIVIVGEDEDKTFVADLLAEMGETITSDVNVNISHSKDNTNFFFGVTADADVFVDWTNPKYAVMFSVIFADGIGAPANADLVAGIREYYETGKISALSLAFNSLTTAQVITALKNLAMDDNFTAMVAGLGLDDVVEDDVITLEALLDKIGKGVAYMVRRADLTGGSRTLGSYLNADESYGISRENFEKLFTRGLFKGYAITAEIEIPKAAFALKIFNENTVDIDFRELNNQITDAESRDENLYTPESWAEMKAAWDAAVEVRKTATTQKAVDNAALALKEALAALELKPVAPDLDYDEINAQITDAESRDENLYTPESWAEMKAEWDAAVAAKATATTQKELDDAALALKEALAALEEKTPAPVLDYDEINAQIADAESRDENLYTPESWAEMKAEWDAAVAAKATATTQKELDDAANALRDALAALELKAPVFVGGTGELALTDSDKVAAYVVDLNGFLLAIDGHKDGITAADLKAMLMLQAENADEIEIVITYADGTVIADNANVPNGAKINATARRNGTDKTDEVSYTVIVMGDTNANGRIDIGDASKIAKVLVGDETFTELQQMAANMNANGRIDIGDATKIASKLNNDWANYESLLNPSVVY